MADTFSEVKEVIVELLGVDESKVTPEALPRGIGSRLSGPG